MPFERGKVLLALFPNSNLQTAKRRPVLSIQRANLASGLHQTVVAMISSNMSRMGHPSRVVILASSSEGRSAGLLLDSVVMTDNLATLHDREIERVLGELSDMSRMDDARNHTLGLQNH